MKPTKEIIGLAKKLYELGYRQEIEYGDWFVNPGDACYLNDHHHTVVSSIPIVVPSLEDGLKWLKEHCTTFDITGDSYGATWVSLWNKTKCIVDVNANPPHEAVLKAMVKVLEDKNGNS